MTKICGTCGGYATISSSSSVFPLVQWCQCPGPHDFKDRDILALRSALQSIASLSAPECGLAPEMARKALSP